MNKGYLLRAIRDTRFAALSTIGGIPHDAAAPVVSAANRSMRLAQALEVPLDSQTLTSLEAQAVTALGGITYQHTGRR